MGLKGTRKLRLEFDELAEKDVSNNQFIFHKCKYSNIRELVCGRERRKQPQREADL